jgi:hypothetical protein
MKVRPGYLKRILGGAIFGLYMGHLVFFLNPQIDMTAGRLALVSSVYAILWGLILGTLLWLLRVARVKVFGRAEGEHKPHGFEFIVAASLISTATFWGHLEFFRVFLPRAAVAALSNATTILGAASFLLLLVWLFEREIDRRVPNLALVLGALVVALSVAIIFQRQDLYVEPSSPAIVATVAPREIRPVTIVVVESLPYDWVVTLEGSGLVPNLEALVATGYFARVHPFNTSSARALSASLATGKLPNRHGVTGLWSYRTLLNRNDPWLNIPRGVSFRNWGLIPPVERISAPLPSGSQLPIWGMLARAGQPAIVANWPFSHGRFDERVIGISDRGCIEANAAPTAESREMLARACADADLMDPNLLLRLEPVGAAAFERIRDTLRSDEAAAMTALGQLDGRGNALVTISINALRVTTSALDVRDNRLPDTGRVDGDSLRAIIEKIDQLIGRIDRQREGDILIVASYSGPAPPPLPSNPVIAISELLDSEVAPGREDGFVVITGDVRHHRDGAPIVSVVDVVPTALFAAGMPVARDMDGRIVTEAFEGTPLSRRGVSYIQSYEQVAPAAF